MSQDIKGHSIIILYAHLGSFILGLWWGFLKVLLSFTEEKEEGRGREEQKMKKERMREGVCV